MRSSHLTRFCLAAPLLLVLLDGCNDGPKIVQVTGTLTYKGQPVPNTYLYFLPEQGRQSWAETDQEGRFKINYDRHQDGAVVGKHKVWLESKGAPQQEPGMPSRQQLSKEMAALFAKYSGTASKLTVDITSDTKDLKLDLD